MKPEDYIRYRQMGFRDGMRGYQFCPLSSPAARGVWNEGYKAGEEYWKGKTKYTGIDKNANPLPRWEGVDNE